jgi:hypothetical protein
MFRFALPGITSWLGEQINSMLGGTDKNRGSSVAGIKKIRGDEAHTFFGECCDVRKKKTWIT